MRFKSISLVVGIVLLFVANGEVWREVAKQDSTRVVFFDVGQGDAIFIETEYGHQILVDGGRDERIVEKLSGAMPFWDTSLDAVILTHPDNDHMGGLIDVLKRYSVEYIFHTGVEKEGEEYARWQELLAAKENQGATIVRARSPQAITWFGQGLGNFLEILYPWEDVAEESNINETSIIAKLKVGDASVLLTGDTTKKVERLLIEEGVDIDVDILKVAHHGSKTSTVEEFVERVRPQLAVIQVGGDNRYGHPHPAVLATLEEYGIEIRRTDQEGDITLHLYNK